MLDENKVTLAEYRIGRAEECLNSSESLIKIKDYSASLNRSYYSIFHAVRAIFALEGVDRKKHSGVIAYFQQNYVKTGIFEKKYSNIVQEAFEIRQESDYEDFYIISVDDAVNQLDNAKEFVNLAKNYIEKRMSEYRKDNK